MSDESEQLRNQRRRLVADAETVGKKIKDAGATTICPFCNNNRWTVLDNFATSTGIFIPRTEGHFPVYTLSCTQCGFIRQHLRQTLDEKLEDAQTDAKFRP